MGSVRLTVASVNTALANNTMVDTQQILLATNMMVAVGSAVAGLWSYVRGGFVAKFIRSMDDIEQTKQQVNEIHEWKDDVEVVLVALAKDSDDMSLSGTKDILGIDTRVDTLLNEKEREVGIRDEER